MIKSLGPERGWPSFFVIGAPKCGTSSFYLHLQGHKGVFAPHVKEPHYFADDFPAIRKRKTATHYRTLYSGAPEEALCGDGSVWYLYSRTAIRNIEAVVPHARYFVLLRDPVRAVQSLHGHLLRTLDEELESFAAAWSAQDARRDGQRIPATCREPRFLQYREVYDYALQLDRLFDFVPRARVKIYVFEELITTPREHYLNALEFLDLKDDGRTDFPGEVENSILRDGRLAFLMRAYAAPIWWEIADRPVTRRVEAVTKRLGLPSPSALKDTIKGSLFSTAPRQILAEEVNAQLHAYFSESIAATERTIGRSLHMWRPIAA